MQTVSDLRALNRLLDSALDVPVEQRTEWLAALAGEDATYRPLLEELLALDRAGPETHQFLATLPKLDGTTPGLAPDLSEGDQIGTWSLVSLLGSGGMGTVWLARRHDGLLDRNVALKLPHAGWHDQGLQQRFAREKDILASLEHPAIARLYDAGFAADRRPWLAMEYVQGEPIDVWCRSHESGLRERVGLTLQVAAAIAYAHSRLIVHRDLKPSNVLVDAQGQVHLLDFGIAKLVGLETDAGLTQLTGRALTLDYASPEQIRGEPVGTQADVYSLGVLCYELLCGQRPYRLKRGSAAELEEAITHVEPMLASQAGDRSRARQLTGDLDAILNKALKKPLDQRYVSVEAFAQDLQAWLDGAPVKARPDSLAYRSSKFLRRHAMPIGAAALVVMALVAGLSVAAWQARHATLQAERAERVKRYALSIFENADPDNGSGVTTSAKDLLTASRAQIDRDLANDPGMAAEILTSVAYSLIGLGDAAQSITVIEHAFDLAKIANPPVDARSVATMHAVYGEALSVVDRSDEALPHLEQAARDGSWLTQAGANRWLAEVANQQGRLQEALPYARKAFEIAAGHPDEVTATERATGYETLAFVLGITNQPGRTEAAAKALEMTRLAFHDDSSRAVLDARMRYGSSLGKDGDPSGGAREIAATLPPLLEKLGEVHPKISLTYFTLAAQQRDMGDVKAARASLTIVGRIEDQLAGERPTRTQGLAHFAMATTILAARDGEDASAEAARSAELFERALGPKAGLTRRAYAMTALAAARRGDVPGASKWLAQIGAEPVKDRDEQARIDLPLAEVNSAMGLHEEAERLARSVVATQSAAAAANGLQSIQGRAVLGVVLARAGKAAEARPILVEARDALRPIQPDGSADIAFLETTLGEVQQALGQAVDARTSLKSALNYWDRAGNEGPDAKRARAALAGLPT
ncbi:hypothetical protein BH10PSE17_BH10PSE17_02210 [soil metagenome]